MADLRTLPAELRAWGLDVVEVTGWESRRRPGAFDPIGVLIHHTASARGKDAPSLQVCIDGRLPQIPGPLCQMLVARSGKVYVISAGRCNHAGAGGPIGPGPLVGVDEGNAKLIGIELENDGVGEPYPDVQMNAAHTVTAAVMRRLAAPFCVWGHREYAPKRKSDPVFNMQEYRAAVLDLLHPKGPTMPTPASDEMVRQWQEMLLANGAKLGGGADGLFGRLTLEASKVVLDHRNQLLAANKTSADTIVRLTAERDAARAEAARLQALADVAATGPGVQAVLQWLRAQLDEAEAKLQGLV